MSDYLTSLISEDIERLSEIVVARAPSSEKLLPGERRKVAILFLDLSGFTALSEEMDHESVHRLTDGLMGALAKVVEAHGGYVDKFEGDRIMALFGARRAFENDSSRAVSSGLRMMETVREVDTMISASTEIGARVGVGFGAVTVAPDPSGHVTATGEEVNLASRLEETADVNTIQVTPAVRQQCGDLFEWEALGTKEIRGVSHPIEVFRPVGPGRVRKARWDRAARLSSSPLVGRRRELLRLMFLWDKQAAGVGLNRRGGALHLVARIEGEAGTGKSRLADEFLSARIADGEDICLLVGNCQSYAQPPFGLWVSLLRSFLGVSAADPDPSSRLGSYIDQLCRESSDRIASALRSSLPFMRVLISAEEIDPRLASLDEESRHRETLAALRNLVLALASSEPRRRVVLLLDDLQWIDKASEDALAFILANTDTARPMLFICLHRPGTGVIGPGFTLPEACAGYIRQSHIPLDEMDEESSAALVGYILRPDDASSVELYVPSEVSRYLMDRASGNPFLLEELALHLLEEGILVPGEEGWQLSCSLEDVSAPSSVTGLVCARIDRLPEELRKGIQTAAAMGQEFTGSLYETVLREVDPASDALVVLDELTRRGYLRRATVEGMPDSFEFRHTLVRDAAYGLMLLHNRRVIHGHTAEALQELHPDFCEAHPEIVADHCVRARRSEAALEWGLRALHRFRQNYLNEEALTWAARLEALLDEAGELDEGDRQILLQLLEARCKILEHLGRTSELDPIIDRIETIASGADLQDWYATARFMRSIILGLRGRTDDALALTEKVLELARKCGSLDLETRCLSRLGPLHARLGDVNKGMQCHEDALRLAQAQGNTKAEATQKGNIASMLTQLGRFEEGEKLYMEALDLFEEFGDRPGRARMLGGLGVLNGMRKRLERASGFFEEALRINVDIGNRRGEGVILGNLAVCNFELDRVEYALELSRRSLEIHREVGNRRSEGVALNNIGNFLHELGDRQEARESYEQSLSIALEVVNPASEANVLGGLALLEVDEGRLSDAAAHYRKAREIGERLGLSERFLHRMGELRRKLLDAGLDEDDLPWPEHWSPYGSEQE